MTWNTTTEPTETTVFTDVNGVDHPSRDEAIEANFDADFEECASICEDSVSDRATGDAPLIIKAFIQQYPEMTRVLLGDRDMT